MSSSLFHTGDLAKLSTEKSCMRLHLATRAWRTSCKVSGRSGLSPKVSRFKPLSVFTLLVNVADLDPENLLAHLQTWQQGDVSNQEPYNGDFEKAMASIKAKTLVLPGKTDLYFP